MTPDPRATFNLYLKVEDDTVTALRKTLMRAASTVDDDIRAVTGSTPGAALTRAQLGAVKQSLQTKIADLYREQGDIIEAARHDAAAAAIKAFQTYEKTLLSRVIPADRLEAYLASARVTSEAGINAVMQRVYGNSYKPLSYRVYNSEKLSQSMVDRFVENSLAKGLTARQMAAGVRSMINPNVPGGVSYASMRLGRTEINNAFHAYSIDRYQTNKIVEGVDWHLSRSHPEGDVCDELEFGSPYLPTRIPDKPHPMCFCFITPVTPSDDEFLQKLADGEYDNEPWRSEAPPLVPGEELRPLPIPLTDKAAMSEKFSAFAKWAETQPKVDQYDRYTPHGNAVTSQVFRYAGYKDTLPTVVPQLPGSGPQFFRGVVSSETKTATEMAEQFKSGFHFAGNGVIGNGSYFSTSQKTAEWYAENAGGGGAVISGTPTATGAVIRAELKSTARVLELNGDDPEAVVKQLNDIRVAGGGTAETYGTGKKAETYVIGAIPAADDFGSAASILGYDAIHVVHPTKYIRKLMFNVEDTAEDYYIILNRASLFVQS